MLSSTDVLTQIGQTHALTAYLFDGLVSVVFDVFVDVSGVIAVIVTESTKELRPRKLQAFLHKKVELFAHFCCPNVLFF